MAGDTFLKIDGIKGESMDNTHKDEVDITNWNFGLTQSGTTHEGPGAGGGKVNFSDMTISKKCDISTPAIIKNCCSGKHIKEATLTVRKAGGDAPVEYYVVKMTDLIVSSYSTGGMDGMDRFEETITLNFRQVEITYTPQDSTGSGAGAASAGWDIAANAPVG